MRITEAAQLVQHSGYPEAYQAHAADARALASVLTGYSPGGKFSCVVHPPSGHGTGSAVVAAVTGAYGAIGIARTGNRQDVALAVSGQDGNRLGWSVAQFLLARGDSLQQQGVAFDGKQWRTGSASDKGWTSSPAASSSRLVVTMG